MRIVFSGGGTLGPVTPLLALHDIFSRSLPDVSAIWIGTRTGPERRLVEAEQIRFFPIWSGKLRRYASLSTALDILRVLAGIGQSLAILWREKPDVCISAGGFVSVPVHLAAWLLGIPAWVHVQDVRIGVATKLMAPFASLVTTALEEQVGQVQKKNVRWIGNPVRPALLSGTRERAGERFGLDPALPTVFATGGGTGSANVNAIVAEAVPHLAGAVQVIHLTGKGRQEGSAHRAAALFSQYHVYEFFDEEMRDAYATADIVVSRGGFGTIAELAAFGKSAILLPKPGHQEENVRYLAERGAAVLLDERVTTGYHLAAEIKKLLRSPEAARAMGERLGNLLPVADEEGLCTLLQEIVSPVSA